MRFIYTYIMRYQRTYFMRARWASQRQGAFASGRVAQASYPWPALVQQGSTRPGPSSKIRLFHRKSGLRKDIRNPIKLIKTTVLLAITAHVCETSRCRPVHPEADQCKLASATRATPDTTEFTRGSMPKRRIELSAAFVRTSRPTPAHAPTATDGAASPPSSSRTASSAGTSQRLRIKGRPTNMGLGGYPLVTLAEARTVALENARMPAPTRTVPKAKELRRVAEPLITLAKHDSVANRRLAFARLRSKAAVGKLFSELGPRYQERPGGFPSDASTRHAHGLGCHGGRTPKGRSHLANPMRWRSGTTTAAATGESPAPKRGARHRAGAERAPDLPVHARRGRRRRGLRVTPSAWCGQQAPP